MHELRESNGTSTAAPGPAGETNAYLRKHQLDPRTIAARPHARLGMAVVIPCREEPELVTSLESLRACHRPPCPVEVIVVVNGSDADGPAARARNRRTVAHATEWIQEHGLGGEGKEFSVHLLEFPDLPARRAGAGLARKLGMDEAVGRFADIRRTDGIR